MRSAHSMLLATALSAGWLAGPASPAAAAGVAESCQAGKLRLAARAVRCTTRAHAAGLEHGNDARLATAVARCEDARAQDWSLVEQVARSHGSACPSEEDSFWTRRSVQALGARLALEAGERFVDGTTVVHDRRTGLAWERKRAADGVPDPGDPRDADNLYSPLELADAMAVSSCMHGFCRVDGDPSFRLPTQDELETLRASGVPGCRPGTPCLDTAPPATPDARTWALDPPSLDGACGAGGFVAVSFAPAPESVEPPDGGPAALRFVRRTTAAEDARLDARVDDTAACRAARVRAAGAFARCLLRGSASAAAATDPQDARRRAAHALDTCGRVLDEAWTAAGDAARVAGSGCPRRDSSGVRDVAQRTAGWLGLVTGPRFQDPGDGTILDRKLFVQWETRDDADGAAAPEDPRDADNSLADRPWSVALAALNEPPCLAGHCDWEPAASWQLMTVVDRSAPGCGRGGACIAPELGPAAAGWYEGFDESFGAPQEMDICGIALGCELVDLSGGASPRDGSSRFGRAIRRLREEPAAR
ncbi:hypothetical protein KGQ64_09980 [bacterium]|nr:hypothetical protein [bacterium]